MLRSPIGLMASRVEASVRCAIVINTFPTPSARTQRILSTYSAPWARSILATALNTHPHTRHTVESIQPCVPCAKIQRQGFQEVGCEVSSHAPGMLLGSPCCSSPPHNTAKKKSTSNNAAPVSIPRVQHAAETVEGTHVCLDRGQGMCEPAG